VPDRDLPTYTIIAPLYREAGMAAQLLASLKAIDYPVLDRMFAR
jgi:cellulose synthase/poly-beta-1,6-N-acetylglucosamine synthase-like glycosyltransferase